MKKLTSIIAVAALMCVLIVPLGCSSNAQSTTETAAVPKGAPSLMPANHADRFGSLGASGCYGCHGANEMANPMLVDAVVIPEDHYLNGTYATLTLDPVREQCITCHPQG